MDDLQWVHSGLPDPPLSRCCGSAGGVLFPRCSSHDSPQATHSPSADHQLTIRRRSMGLQLLLYWGAVRCLPTVSCASVAGLWWLYIPSTCASLRIRLASVDAKSSAHLPSVYDALSHRSGTTRRPWPACVPSRCPLLSLYGRTVVALYAVYYWSTDSLLTLHCQSGVKVVCEWW